MDELNTNGANDEPIIDTGAEPQVDLPKVDEPVKADILDEPVLDEPKGDEPDEGDDLPKGEDGDEPVKADDDSDESKVDEIAPEPITFDAAEDLPAIAEKAAQVVEKYELPAEVQSLIDTYKTKAESNVIAEFEDYGTKEEIQSALDRESLLQSFEDKDGAVRPNTDKYVQSLRERDSEKVDWLYFDMSTLPSTKYQGLTKFQESLCDAFGQEGDTIGTVMKRYEQAQSYIAGTAIPESDMPQFIIDAKLQKAYQSLPKETREDITLLAPDADGEDYDAANRARKLDELSKIQKGIESDERDAQAATQKQQDEVAALQQEVVTTQEAFYKGMENLFVEKLIKEVKFSDDPKIQSLQAKRSAKFLKTAFYDDADGAEVRTTLADNGIEFNYTLARQLVRDIEVASIALTEAKRIKDKDGEPLNKVAVLKATTNFKTAGKKWQDFADGILEQESRLTAIGTAEAVKVEAAKIKVAVKARPAAKGTPTPATKKEVMPAYKSKEWYDKIVNDELAEEQKRVAAYQ